MSYPMVGTDDAGLHIGDDLKNTGKGNLFAIFGEPDIDVITSDDGQIQVRIKGVDVFHSNAGEVRSAGPDNIGCWFIDTTITKRASSFATPTSSTRTIHSPP